MCSAFCLSPRIQHSRLKEGELMSAYSIVNLKEEVENSMGERAPGIEGRFARKQLAPSTLESPICGIAPASAHLRRIATANRRRPTSSSAAPAK